LLLVKRDVRVLKWGSVGAIALFILLGLGRFGALPLATAAGFVVVLGLLLAAACVSWWLIGPKSLRKQRYMVLAPACLVSGPVLISLQSLGLGAGAVVISAAFGFGAAIALGMAVASRRRA
jgi:hypothetical protein